MRRPRWMPMMNRRLTRLTTAFSKTVEHQYAVAVFVSHDPSCKRHKTLRVTPAMEAGVADPLWERDDRVALIG